MPIDPSISLGGNPNIALGANPPPDLLDQAAKAMTLKHLMGEQQLEPMKMQAAQLDLQQKQKAAAGEEALGKAFAFKSEGGIDLDSTMRNLDMGIKSGAIPAPVGINAAQMLLKQHEELATEMRTKQKNAGKEMAQQAASIMANINNQAGPKATKAEKEAIFMRYVPVITAMHDRLVQFYGGNHIVPEIPPGFNLDMLEQIAGLHGPYLAQELKNPHEKFMEEQSGLRTAAQQTKADAAKAMAESEKMTPEEIHVLAGEAAKDRSILTGMGRTAQGARNLIAINKEMADMEISGGKSIAGTRAQFKGDAASMQTMQKQYDAITSFEKNAIRNGDKLIALADKVDSTGSPALERWIRGGRKSLEGDADVAALDAQLQVYRTEAARILTNPNLTGVLSDSARQEVNDFVNKASSAKQIRSVVGLLKSDFGNRKQTLEDQLGEARGRMESGKIPGQETGEPKSDGGLPKVTSDTDYENLPSGTVFIGPDGKQRKKP